MPRTFQAIALVEVEKSSRDAGEHSFETVNGPRAFAAGDRLVFLENARALGGSAADQRSDTSVKNGMLGSVLAVTAGEITVRLDAEANDRPGRVVHIPTDRYQAFDHGYATTIHKTQGATVDRAFVLGSQRMDRHLTYVAMTRHTQAVTLYAGHDEFADLAALSAKLSRNGSKETTLDYTDAFLAQRGIAARLGVESEISVSPALLPPANVSTVATVPAIDAPAIAATRAEPPQRKQPVQKSRGIFANFKPNAQTPMVSPRGPRQPPLAMAVERYAVAHAAILAVKEHGLPVGPETRAIFQQAESDLEATQPGALKLLQSAAKYDPATRLALMAPAGERRGAALVACMAREQAAVLDPIVRAGRLIDGLAVATTALTAAKQGRVPDVTASAKLALQGAIAGIGRDHQAQQAMRDHAIALKINPRGPLGLALAQPDVAKALVQSLDPPKIVRDIGFSR